MPATTVCVPCCPTVQSVNVPGIQGADGADATNGVNAFALYTGANTTVPANPGDSATFAVDSSAWMVVGQIIIAAITATTWAHFQVTALPTTTSVTLEYLGYPGDVPGGTALLTGTKFGVAGMRGGGSVYITSTAVNLSATAFMDVILTTADGKTITLPTAIGITGKVYTVKQTAAHAAGTTIATSGGQTIDGAATKTTSAQYKSYTMVSDGANWAIIAVV